MSKKLSYTITIALVIVSCGLTFAITELIHYQINKTTQKTIEAISGRTSDMDSYFDFNPSLRYRFIKPIKKSEPKDESPSFNKLKSRINNYVENLKRNNKLVNASVYLRYYGHGSWMSLNPNETYNPGSLFKVFNLVVYLKMSEQNPGLLEKTMVYNTPTYQVPIQTYNSKQLETGKVYTIRELLKYMIAYSDNKATCWLVGNIGNKRYLEMLDDLKILLPPTKDSLLTVTAPQYSEIIKKLYKASYLTPENSEFALSLLNQCEFKMGLMNGLPDKINVAHKFGEAALDGIHQLHESGLVYMDYAPYLITIMTKGPHVEDLPKVISTISKMVYDEISQMDE